jgi:hypothetical protein
MEKRTKMKLRKTILILIVITFFSLLIIPTNPLKGQESIYTSPTYRFELDGETNFTVVSRAPLSWEENVEKNFSITFGATNINVSHNISITYVDITYVYPDNETEARYLHAEDFVLNITNQVYNINTTLIAPNDYNLFNISIEIIAHSSTNSSDTLFIAYFPGDRSYIQVEREGVNPIINLPGFPDPLTFSRWIVIYIIILLVMITPALFVGIPKTIELSKIGIKKLKEFNTPEKREARRIKKLQKKAKKEEN